MQLRGRTVVIGIFVLAVLMAGGAWWRRLQESRHAAAYWGARRAPLIVGNTKVFFVILSDHDGRESEVMSVAGRPVAKAFDLSEKLGLVHLRYALTQDVNFDWNKLRTVPLDDPGHWAYALRFFDESATLDRASLDVVLDRGFRWLGVVDLYLGTIKIVACPRLAPKLKRYLADVKVPLAP
jgi:hypothetical protein